MDDLKPCPFCGDKWPSQDKHCIKVVRCGMCGASGPIENKTRDLTNNEMAAAWNARKGDEL